MVDHRGVARYRLQRNGRVYVLGQSASRRLKISPGTGRDDRGVDLMDTVVIPAAEPGSELSIEGGAKRYQIPGIHL